jgi:hypothetical protein
MNASASAAVGVRSLSWAAAGAEAVEALSSLLAAAVVQPAARKPDKARASRETLLFIGLASSFLVVRRGYGPSSNRWSTDQKIREGPS